VTVRPLVLFEVFDPLVERPRDVFLRRPIKAKSIKPRYVLVGVAGNATIFNEAAHAVWPERRQGRRLH
jgi:hypothetical protein